MRQWRWHARLCWLVGIGVVVHVVPLRALRAQEERGDDEHPRITAVSFDGVTAVNTAGLRASIATQGSHCRSPIVQPVCLFTDASLFVEHHYLDRLELARDLLRIRVYYWLRGYREASVDTTVTPDGDEVAVTFHVTEGPPTRISSIRVLHPDSVVTTRLIESAMELHAGEPLNLLLLDSTRVHLRDALWQMGYADAVIDDSTAVDDSLRSAAIRLTVAPGKRAIVDTIVVRGNERVSDRVIRNSLALRQGQPFRLSDVFESQRNLYTSGLFTRVHIPAPQGMDSLKRILVEVREAPLHQVHTSAGFNTADFVQVEGRYTDFNWLGGARELDLRAVVGNLLAPALNGHGIFQDVTPGTLDSDAAAPFLDPNWEASANVTQRWFHSSRNTLSYGVFAHRRSAPAIFIDRGFGGDVTFTREVRMGLPVSLDYHLESSRVEADGVYFCVSFGICQQATIGALRASNMLSPLTLTASSDRSDDPLDPRSGYRFRIDAEHASAFTLSDYRYNRVSGDGSRYTRVGGAVLALHVRAGWVGALASTVDAVGLGSASSGVSIIHPRKRFYAGGANSVRGYGENQLGPRVLTIDPAVLRRERVVAGDTIAGCTDASIADGTCDPTGIPSGEFEPRPLGGTSILEGSAELRFALSGPLWGAVFIDGAIVGEGSAFANLTQATTAITPGFGIRYRSPVGPIRVDFGFRPRLTERLPVITQSTTATGATQLVTLRTEKLFDPLEGSQSGIRRVLNRFTLHLSIGQAF
ncbi:MAG TPA: BamA/TamA family outer membrane protein [Gemmatimonadaceae bacterium]|nr:BamA/TamA family outer membrane protein [Gemmatimonadaceae bacterium]